MNTESILVKMGRAQLEKPLEPIHFLDNPEQNAILNDIEHYPHLFVLGCVMDLQSQDRKIWSIPFRVGELVGGLDIKTLASVSLEEYNHIFSENNLHRFKNKVGARFYHAVQKIMDDYDGDASKIWNDTPSSSMVVLRFLAFKGMGVKIATMAANRLAREFHVKFSDYSSIDVSPDVHIKRVLYRMGLIPPGVDRNDPLVSIYVARDICPEFPGIIDIGLWNIGHNYCSARKPHCENCPAKGECATAKGLVLPQ